MFQILTILLFFLRESSFALDSCQVLFVVDGSDYWSAFRSEILSITTTANLVYASSSNLFSANYWVYGDVSQDQAIPTFFLESKDDFLNELGESRTFNGKEYIDGATNKLNRWSVWNAVIVIYTASPQNLITAAGSTYTEQARTVAVHLNDGVDMSPISIYPSPQLSDSQGLVGWIVNACKNIPQKAQCPTNWVYNDKTDSCYYLQSFTNVTTPNGTFWQVYNWTTAESNCQQMDAHLVSIHSKEEDDFVYGLVASNVKNLTNAPDNYPCLYQKAWIGLEGNGTIGNGNWTDGSPVDYVGYGSMTFFYYDWNISNDPSCGYHFWDWQYTPNATLSRYVCKMPSKKSIR